MSGTGLSAGPMHRSRLAAMLATALLGSDGALAQGARLAEPPDAATKMPMGQEGHAGMGRGSMQGGSAPPDARDPHAYSDGVPFTRGSSRLTLMDGESVRSVLVDNFEAMRIAGDTLVQYDLEAWIGPTYDRFVLKAEGELNKSEIEESRTEFLWGHAVSPFWDTQLGLRYDTGPGPNRSWLAFGLEGLAPYWFELALTGYVGESSRTALRLDASYELRLTQKLVLQPRLEANLYGKADSERGRGSGLSDVTAALRLRYELVREVAPYIGVEWMQQYGATENFTRLAGGDPSDARIVAGVRAWF